MTSIAPDPPRILVVDDEPSMREMLSILLRRAGYQPVLAPGLARAREALSAAPKPFPLVITDLAMPDGSGIDVLAAAKARDPTTEVVVVTAHSTVENAIEAMRAGAYDFVAKPFTPAEIAAVADKALEKHALTSENRRLKARVSSLRDHEVLGKSAPMRAVLDLIDRVAATKTTVLVTGESGTGKERVARLIHERSDRAGAPFLVVNCGALPEALMESELFGHEKGAFTGAQAKHLGLFRAAEGGTVLLDEVGELPAPLQVKLLRVLQERTVRPVGAAQEIPVDVRVLAATNRDVEAQVEAGSFRRDLYYRLNVVRIELAPLSARAEDISPLVEHFVKRFATEMGKDVRGLTPDALRAIERYSFPGNVRELENVIERAVALAGSSAIGVGDLTNPISGAAGAARPALLDLPEGGMRLDEVLSEAERRLLVDALDRTGGVRRAAAELLGITFRSLRYRLTKHGLGGDDPVESDADPDIEL